MRKTFLIEQKGDGSLPCFQLLVFPFGENSTTPFICLHGISMAEVYADILNDVPGQLMITPGIPVGVYVVHYHFSG